MHFLVYDESPHQLLCFAGQKDGLQPDVFNIFVALKRLKNSCLFSGPNTYFDSLIVNPCLGEHVLNLAVLVVDNFLKEIIISRREQNCACIEGKLHQEFISEKCIAHYQVTTSKEYRQVFLFSHHCHGFSNFRWVSNIFSRAIPSFPSLPSPSPSFCQKALRPLPTALVIRLLGPTPLLVYIQRLCPKPLSDDASTALSIGNLTFCAH